MSRTSGLERRRSAPRRRTASLLREVAIALVMMAALLYLLVDQGYVPLPAAATPTVPVAGDPLSYRFAPCAAQDRTCVVDGDTIRIAGERIRIADIDTPEVRDYACPAEKALGDAATRRMIEMLNAGPFSLEMWDHRDTDFYGRKLRVVTRGGQSLGMALVAEGLARPWGGARESWCG